MRLKHQLLLLGLLSLLFPITGWFALKRVDEEYRASLELANKSTLSSLQASLEIFVKQNPMLDLHGFVLTSINTLIIDGYDTDWINVEPYRYQTNDHRLRVSFGDIHQNLAMIIESNDNTININADKNSANDAVLIGILEKDKVYQYKFYRQGEGEIKAEPVAHYQPEIRAFWHEKATGYALEVLIYAKDISRVGFVGIDQQPTNENITGTLEENTLNRLSLKPIASNNPNLQAIIDSITPHNNKFSVKDRKHRILYQSDKLPKNNASIQQQWFLTPIYQWLFGITKTNENQWFYRKIDGMAGLVSKQYNDNLFFELKTMMPQGQQKMVLALLKAALSMLLVVGLLISAYLVYALWLALRIKKLNHSLHKVLDDSGELTIKMPFLKSSDELGELSRDIESMLLEMQEYTQYLKDVGSRLSHEMKTPLAIVQSSLDNMELDGIKSDFLKRSQSGVHRLKFILNQLSEVSQLKYTLENTQKEKVNLTQLCKQLGESYQSLLPNLELQISKEALFIEASGELIAQLVDKLVENAKDFCPHDGVVEIGLIKEGEQAVLSVSNTGSQLPRDQASIFNSLVSIRKTKTNKAHMGMGLFIVKLIARFHQIEISAINQNFPKKVIFSMKIKLIH